MSHALVIGAGPAGLMAADVLASRGVSVSLCDAKPSVGRKLLMAGKSGLNLTKNEDFETFMPHYFEAAEPLRQMIKAFDAQKVQAWSEGMGQQVFTGSSGRVFPTAMKASPLLRAWLVRLETMGVSLRTRWRWTGWEGEAVAFDTPEGRQTVSANVVVLALGGASWARLGSDGAWSDVLGARDVPLTPFSPSNVGLSMNWSDHMTAHFGSSLKAVHWRAGDMRSRGEAILSREGLEGSGIYALTPALRQGEALCVDLLPDVTAEKLEAELDGKPAKQRLAHWLKNTLKLPPVKTALFLEQTSGAGLPRTDWVETVKNLRIQYAGLRDIDEAISTAGGVAWSAVTDDLMLRNIPGVFCAGEMLDWEAPTGGYLITACLATGQWAGLGALRYLDAAA